MQSVADLVANDNLIKLARSPELLQALQTSEFANAMHSDAFLKLIVRRDIQAALVSKDFLTAMKRAEIVQQFVALDLQPEYAALMKSLNAELAPALARVELIKMFHDPAVMNAISNVEVRSHLTNASLVRWLSQADAAELFADGLFVDAIHQAEFLAAFQADGFVALFNSPAFEASIINR